MTLDDTRCRVLTDDTHILTKTPRRFRTICRSYPHWKKRTQPRLHTEDSRHSMILGSLKQNNRTRRRITPRWVFVPRWKKQIYADTHLFFLFRYSGRTQHTVHTVRNPSTQHNCTDPIWIPSKSSTSSFAPFTTQSSIGSLC